ncbi:MAG: hypothetical protein FD123_1247 [Bacteroidetes bacterium]|nr:MAG: hypothetical protein FD123_1247 [Bacteroidota bacterium]
MRNNRSGGFLRSCFLVAAMFPAVTPASAIAYTWLGATSSWTSPANWSPAGVPGPGDVVTISAATPNDPAISANTNISGLTMNNNHTIVLNGFNLGITSVATVSLTNASLGLFASGGGSVDITAPAFSFSNVIFDAALTVTKNGAAIATSSGCYYNGITVFNNTTNSFLRLGAGALPDYFNDDLTLNNSSTGWINASYNSAGNSYARNVYVNSSSGGGITFGTAGGTSTLAAGFVLAEGVTGFTRGTLDIRNFVQLGGAAQALDLSWPGPLSASSLVLTLGPNVVFNGSATFVASNLLLNGVTFNGASTALTKVVNGGSLNTWTGGNTFNSNSTTITNATGTSEMRIGAGTPDTYNGNVTFHRVTGGAILNPAYDGINNFFGNVTVSTGYMIGGGTAVTFGAGSGTARFAGNNPQTISKTVAIMSAPVFHRMDVDKTLNDVTLNSPVAIMQTMAFTTGLVHSAAANRITLQPGAITNMGNAASYNNGPINCIVAAAGNSSLIFPVGKSGAWRPAVLNTTHSDASAVTYNGEVIASSAAALSYTLPFTISNVSSVRYWQIDRQAVANFISANVTLYYDLDDGVTNYPNLTVAKTIGTGTAWFDVGGTATANGTGSISSGVFASFSKFVLANATGGSNPLPVELLSFTAGPGTGQVDLDWVTATEVNNDFFTVERSNGMALFEAIATVDGAGNSSASIHYAIADYAPLEGDSYYRLRQTDFDGHFSYSQPVHVRFEPASATAFLLYPNPSCGPVLLAFPGTGNSWHAALHISDPAGKIIFKTPVLPPEQHDMILPALAPGIYVVTIETASSRQSQKLIITR